MAFLLDAAAQLKCPHGGQIAVVATDTRVKISGVVVLRLSDGGVVTGCMNDPPCDSVAWQSGSVRFKVGGVSVLLANSAGICMAGKTPTGNVAVVTKQPRVSGI